MSAMVRPVLSLDLGVGVEQRHVQRLGQPPPDGGLARAGHAHQHGLGCHQPDACAGSGRSPVRAAATDAQVGLDVGAGLGQRVAAELLQRRARQHQRHHGLDDDAGGGHRAHVGALVDRDGLVAGGHVDGGQRARHRGDRLHRGAHPQRLAVGHAALETAGAVGRAHHAVGAGVHLVVGDAAAAARGLEAVADLDALDGLDAHDRGGELAVEPVVAAGERARARSAGPSTTTSTTPPRVSPSFLAASISAIIDCFGVLVECAHRAVVDRGEVARLRRRAVVGLGRADRDDVREHLDAERLAQELPARRCPRRRGRRSRGRWRAPAPAGRRRSRT